MRSEKSRFSRVRLGDVLRRHFGANESVPRRLSYQPNDQEHYTFEEGRLLLNGTDLGHLVEQEDVQIELLACLAGAIDEYRRKVWDRYGTEFRSFNAATQGLLSLISGKLGQTYEALSAGLKIRYQNGRLWINDIDPKVVLSLFLSNPTRERRGYLRGLSSKLALILEGKAGSALSDGVLQAVRRLFVQISKSLHETKMDDGVPLLAAAVDLGT